MINFFTEDIEFELHDPEHHHQWIKSIITKEGYELKELNYIFCSDDYLHNINVEYLDHDTLTDIITFDNSEVEKEIEGDIFISIERVEDNAKDMDLDFKKELARVLIHGTLHLLGYKDKTAEEKTVMRQKEDESITSL